jgi:hypothetical protein
LPDFVLHPGWETALVGIPFILILIFVFFRLDEVFVSSKRRKATPGERRKLGGQDENGEPVLYDPDGRPSRKPRRR